MSDKDICGDCRYCSWNPDDEDYICLNVESEYYCDYVGYTDYCEEFESRNIDQ